jgi:K+-sensing histidine kinase KdpD
MANPVDPIGDFTPAADSAGSLDRLPAPLHYLLSLVAVALAAAVGLSVQGVIATPNLTLVFVLPVMVAAMMFGWGPSLVAAVASALAFDVFFTEPKYSLRISSPADLWATGLLLLIGAIVSALAAEARRRALDSRRTATQAKALQGLAHAVIVDTPRQRILELAAAALSTIFGAPAMVVRVRDGQMAVLAASGGAAANTVEMDAAKTAIDAGAPTRAATYPTEAARFDFWPVVLAGGEALAVGLDFSRDPDARPADPTPHVEAVCGYLAAALRDGRA